MFLFCSSGVKPIRHGDASTARRARRLGDAAMAPGAVANVRRQELKQYPALIACSQGVRRMGLAAVQKTRGADRRGRVSVANGCGRYDRRRRVRSRRSRQCRRGDRNSRSAPGHHGGFHRYPDAGFDGRVEARPRGQGPLAADQDRRDLRPRPRAGNAICPKAGGFCQSLTVRCRSQACCAKSMRLLIGQRHAPARSTQ